MQQHQVAREGESQAGTKGLMLTIVAIIKTLKEMLLPGFRDTTSIILHLNNNMIVGTVGLHLQDYLTTFFSIL